MLSSLIVILVIVVVCGGAAWLLGKAPIDGNIKQWGVWAIYLVAFILIVRELLALANVSI